jgi:hypothetical protein
MLRNDPGVARRYQSKHPDLLRRRAPKISRVMRVGQVEKKVAVQGTVSAMTGAKSEGLNSK